MCTWQEIVTPSDQHREACDYLWPGTEVFCPIAAGLRSLNVGGWTLDASVLQDLAAKMPRLTSLEAADCMV